MKKLAISSEIKEKIYDLKLDKNQPPFLVTTYFPLDYEEKRKILTAIEDSHKNHVKFKSIFTDNISKEEWEKSKKQIKKKFQDELFDIK